MQRIKQSIKKVTTNGAAKSRALEIAIADVIRALGEDVQREGLVDTPRRVAAAYEKMLEGYKLNPKELITTFDAVDYDEMIIVKDIEFYSMCEHHMFPFFGKAHIGYIPNGKIIGLSKIPRVVEIFSRRLQNQERLTVEVAKTLESLIAPKGVGVVLEGKHLCMMARGVKKQGSTMLTSAMRGLFKKNMNTRGEFLKLIGK
ncbi:GTP cyclohydrolase I FolE [Candidatus Peregrinibacteria bacterium CG11_big_fil_rev_8_21_14_0_20_46_8]|nr:MAG: GTP cyclohydrolase I FolE [Candidatus Peregrinibacteria bacterium CG11_big_fil_rev_8_21_14_0_20_46_8]